MNKRFPIIIESTYDLPEWEEDVDVSEFRDSEKPTKEYAAVPIPPEAYRSDALLPKGGVYFIHNRGKQSEGSRPNKRRTA